MFASFSRVSAYKCLSPLAAALGVTSSVASIPGPASAPGNARKRVPFTILSGPSGFRVINGRMRAASDARRFTNFRSSMPGGGRGLRRLGGCDFSNLGSSKGMPAPGKPGAGRRFGMVKTGTYVHTQAKRGGACGAPRGVCRLRNVELQFIVRAIAYCIFIMTLMQDLRDRFPEI